MQIQINEEAGFLSILEISLHAAINEHACLRVYGILKSADERTLTEAAKRDIEVNITTEETCIPVFVGKLISLKVSVIDDVIYAWLECASLSIYFQQKEKYRAFQNENMTVKQLLMAIPEEGHNIVVADAGENVLNRQFIQYGETDWEFAKRIAGDFHGIIIPDIIGRVPQIAFGMVLGNTYCISEESVIEHTKIQKQTVQGIRYFDIYKIESGVNYQLGDTIVLSGERYQILEKNLYLDKGLAVFSYLIGDPESVRLEKYINKKIKGISLTGNVIKTSDMFLWVQLDIGDEHKIRDNYCAYEYAPASGNVMYSMPETGTKVRVYFPTGEEDKGVVVSCVHEDMSYPKCDIKQFEIQGGNVLLFNPGEMSIVNMRKGQSLAIGEEQGISFFSDSKLSMYAEEEIIISSRSVAELSAQDEINLISKGSKDNILLSGNDIVYTTKNLISSGVPHRVKIDTDIQEKNRAICNSEQYAANLFGGLSFGELSEIQQTIISAIPLFTEADKFRITDVYAIKRRY